MKNDDRPGCPRTFFPTTTLKIARCDLKDRSLGVRAVAKGVSLDRENVRRILREELNMRMVCSKIVPKLLSDKQKERRKELSLDFCNALRINQIC